MLVYCYSRCSTCKKALKYLDELGLKYEVRDLKENKPSKEELSDIYKNANLPINKLFNTSGKLYKEMNLKDKVKTMSAEEALELLSTDGMLVKRPLLINEKEVLVGFKEEEYAKLVK